MRCFVYLLDTGCAACTDADGTMDGVAAAAASAAAPASLESALPDAHIETFANPSALLRRLLVSADYIVHWADVAGGRSRPLCEPNTNEEEVYYPVAVLINGHSSHDPDQPSAADFLAHLIRIRFRTLHPVVRVFDFGQPSALTEVADALEALAPAVTDRLSRVQGWIGLRDKLLPPSFSSMPRMVQNSVEVADSVSILSYLGRLNHFDLLGGVRDDDGYYTTRLLSWDFPAYALSVDELLYTGYLILRQPLRDCLAELGLLNSRYHDFQNALLAFLFYVRDNYRLGNPFHNFRHAIDVLQATNYFLLQLQHASQRGCWDVPFSKQERLALLLAALGHDLGHPATTNQILKDTGAPIAQIFDNKSVLENFHQSQFRRACKPFLLSCGFHTDSQSYIHLEDLITKAILATDMAGHDQYVLEIPKYAGYKSRDERMVMLASLLIKCADISNVCRPLHTSVKWALSLGREFEQNNQFVELFEGRTHVTAVKPPAFAIRSIEPEQATRAVPALAKSQLFFIGRFAETFFRKIGQSIPPLQFLYDQLALNKQYWQNDQAKREL